ncbi:unnamed protein product [Brassica oleracea var. botrytis]
MVASRLVEFLEDIVDETEVDLPPMMFAEGEEPVGLVIVEAVPALTEVVQDAPSSSESESEDDEIEYPVRKAKKKTLSPAHAKGSR